MQSSTFYLKLGSFLIIYFMVGCLTGSDDQPSEITFEGVWQQEGLGSRWINNVSIFEGNLYAATKSGLFRRPLSGGDSNWQSLGLENKDIEQVVFLPEGKLLAVVDVKVVDQGETSMFLSTDIGQSWQSWMNNFGGKEGKFTSIASMTTLSKPSDTLFALVGPGSVARSADGGQEWTLAFGIWDSIGAPEKIVTDPFRDGYGAVQVRLGKAQSL